MLFRSPRHPVPASCTPFTVLRYLRGIHGDASLAMTPERRAELGDLIVGMEARYFGPEARALPGAGTGGAEDLGEVARRWAAVAG